MDAAQNEPSQYGEYWQSMMLETDISKSFSNMAVSPKGISVLKQLKSPALGPLAKRYRVRPECFQTLAHLFKYDMDHPNNTKFFNIELNDHDHIDVRNLLITNRRQLYLSGSYIAQGIMPENHAVLEPKMNLFGLDSHSRWDHGIDYVLTSNDGPVVQENVRITTEDGIWEGVARRSDCKPHHFESRNQILSVHLIKTALMVRMVALGDQTSPRPHPKPAEDQDLLKRSAGNGLNLDVVPAPYVPYTYSLNTVSRRTHDGMLIFRYRQQVDSEVTSLEEDTPLSPCFQGLVEYLTTMIARHRKSFNTMEVGHASYRMSPNLGGDPPDGMPYRLQYGRSLLVAAQTALVNHTALPDLSELAIAIQEGLLIYFINHMKLHHTPSYWVILGIFPGDQRVAGDFYSTPAIEGYNSMYSEDIGKFVTGLTRTLLGKLKARSVLQAPFSEFEPNSELCRRLLT
jgi:hypothetical protein